MYSAELKKNSAAHAEENVSTLITAWFLLWTPNGWTVKWFKQGGNPGMFTTNIANDFTFRTFAMLFALTESFFYFAVFMIPQGK